MTTDHTPLDHPVHYYSQPQKYDPVTGDYIANGDPRPQCNDQKPGVITKYQARVDCPKCLSSAGIRNEYSK